jgi:hypothetical protein
MSATLLAPQAPAAVAMAADRHWRLKNYVFFREVPNGVHFDAGARAFVLQGAKLYALVARVLGLMDQGLPLAQIEQALPERLMPAYQRLLAALHAHDMLLDDTEDRAELLALGAPLALQEFVKYLQDHLPAQTYRAQWAAWQKAAVLVVGDGFALKAAAKALADSGVGHLCLRLQGAPGRIGAEELEDHLVGAGVPGQGVDVRAAACTDADFAACALAVFASDQADASAAALAFESRAAALGVPALVAGRFGGHAFVLPLAETGVAGLRELLQWRPASAPLPHSPASLALLGAVAAQQALAWHFGIGVARLRRQAHQVSPYFDISQHALVGGRAEARADAPAGALLALPSAAHSSRLGVPVDRPLATYETLRMQLAPWFDPLTGPFVVPSAQQPGLVLAQLPLYHEALLVRAPRSLHTTGDDSPEQRWVAGWGLNAEQAGMRALALALSQLAQSCRNPAQAVRHSLCSAFDADRWQALAWAQAIAAQPDFAASCHRAWVDPAAADDGAVHLLRRLLKHFSAAPMRLLLSWEPSGLAFVAHCLLGERAVGTGCDTSPRLALQEALGQACSHLQVTDTLIWRGPQWPLGELLPAQWQAAPSLDACASAQARAQVVVRWDLATELALPPGIFSGQASLLAAGISGAAARASGTGAPS